MMSDALAEALLKKFLMNQDFTIPTPYLSIHGADPGKTGANELPYRRQPSTFKVQGLVAVNADRIEFQNLGDVDITHAGIWDSAEGGGFLCGTELHGRNRPVIEANAGDTLVLTPGEVVVKRLE